jgi:hypothetical protein
MVTLGNKYFNSRSAYGKLSAERLPIMSNPTPLLTTSAGNPVADK